MVRVCPSLLPARSIGASRDLASVFFLPASPRFARPMLAAASCRACLLAARRPSSLLLAAAFPTSPRRHRSRRRFYATATATDSSSDAGSSSSSFALEVTDPLVLYENLVRSGRIQRDEAQVRLLYQLRRLHSDLVNYQPSMSLRYLLESSVPNNVTKRDGERDALPSRMLPDFNASRSLVRALTHEDDVRLSLRPASDV